jgi:hypothetical protein
VFPNGAAGLEGATTGLLSTVDASDTAAAGCSACAGEVPLVVALSACARGAALLVSFSLCATGALSTGAWCAEALTLANDDEDEETGAAAETRETAGVGAEMVVGAEGATGVTGDGRCSRLCPFGSSSTIGFFSTESARTFCLSTLSLSEAVLVSSLALVAALMSTS